ncbi:hypothetical protein [Rothia uropygialis]|uniref:hypothetical protein n=1 Tax=Kocuria sp. 36 TaxID=1415402 RepID=UPI001EE9A29D|nr:hypothetical protein [Kocuria sp. 36]
MSDTWVLPTRTPLTTTPTTYPLEGSLGVNTRDGLAFQRWQHQPTATSAAHLWFYVDDGVD